MTMRVAASVLLLLAAQGAAAVPEHSFRPPVGPQENPIIVALPEGRSVIVATTGHNERMLHYETYDENGEQVGDRVNIATTNVYAAAELDDGSFVISWVSNEEGKSGVYAKVFEHSATALGVRMASKEVSPYVSVARDNGGFVMLYEKDGNTIAGKHYNLTTNSFDPEFVIAEEVMPSGGVNRHPVVTATKNGFAVMWQQDNELRSRLFGDDFTSSEDIIEVWDSSSVSSYTVAGLRNGGYLTVWATNDADKLLYGRLEKDKFLIQGTQTSEKKPGDRAPSVCGLASGGFVITYQKEGAAGKMAIFGQQFDEDGEEQGEEFLISRTATAASFEPTVDSTESGVVVAWFTEAGLKGRAITLNENTIHTRAPVVAVDTAAPALVVDTEAPGQITQPGRQTPTWPPATPSPAPTQAPATTTTTVPKDGSKGEEPKEKEPKEEEPKKEEPKGEEAKSGSGSKSWIYLLLVVLLVALAMGGMLFFSRKRKAINEYGYTPSRHVQESGFSDVGFATTTELRDEDVASEYSEGAALAV